MRKFISNDFFKVEFADSTEVSSSGGDSLYITFELTAGGKMINNRIYTPDALKNSVESWLKPYGKPLLVHHQLEDSDPIGRITEVEEQSLDEECLTVLNGNYKALAEVKSAYATQDARKMYKAMHKYGLFENKDWPGLNRLMATARIVDSDAIKKIEDERYVTLSAGQDFHTIQCGKDGAVITDGDACEHHPLMSRKLKDGTVFFIHALSGREASMVNAPANKTSIIQSKSYWGQDSEVREELEESSLGVRLGIMQPEVDSFIIGWKEIEVLGSKILASLISEDKITIEEVKNFSGTPNLDTWKEVASIGKMEDHAIIQHAINLNKIEDELSGEDMKLLEELKALVDSLNLRIIDLEGKLTVQGTDKEVIEEVVEVVTTDTQVVEGAIASTDAQDTTKTCKCSECKCKDYDQVQIEYSTALVELEKLKKVLGESIDHIQSTLGEAVEDQDLESKLKWFSEKDFSQILDTKIQSSTNSSQDEIPSHPDAALLKEVVVNPNEVSVDTTKSKEFEDSFVRQIVDKAKKMKESGKDNSVITRYLAANRRYLPPAFSVNTILENI